MKARYYVMTWDSDNDRFSPQPGVRAGPYSLFGLRKALRALRNLGYPASRFPRLANRLCSVGDPSVLVERRQPRRRAGLTWGSG